MNGLINTCLFGDCRESLKVMSEAGIKAQTCVTSPPYFGLRDYGHPGQLGLESTPEEYISNMVEVFRAVRDVLADDGTLWLNIGDTYAAGGTAGKPSEKSTLSRHGSDGRSPYLDQFGIGKRRNPASGLKPKDLIGIPWMLAFALRADGWYLRQDIIWHKPNPMPESVRDRCTKAHEHLFLLSKSERYFFDNDAIKEPSAGRTDMGKMNRIGRVNEGGEWKSPEQETKTIRNRRSVWTVATRPYKGAHFATFPPALIEPCILAGSRQGDIVLDPFLGSGTTGQVAQELGRNWIGCEINQGYQGLQAQRTSQLKMAV